MCTDARVRVCARTRAVARKGALEAAAGDRRAGEGGGGLAEVARG